MKAGIFGLNIPEGKVKYNDPRLEALTKKFEPKKTTYFLEIYPILASMLALVITDKKAINFSILYDDNRSGVDS